MEQNLSSVDFEKYFHLLSDALAKKVEAFSICDAQGIALWEINAVEKKQFKKTIKLFELENCEKPASSSINVQALDLPDKKILYCAQLHNEQEENIGFLLVQIKLDDLNNKHLTQTSIFSLVGHIATCILHEYKLSNELDSMANELSERYEELNLLYTTDHGIHDSHELTHVLQKLIINCAEHLDVAVATLIIPDKVISVTHQASADFELSTQVEKIKNLINKKLTINKSSLVINNSVDAAGIFPDYTCKMLASPVIDSDGSVIGSLMIVKNKADSNYTNSDRNLLEAMSMKASKIIQENYDALTGLLNRAGYEKKITGFLQTSRTQELSPCILSIDIDNLQVINNTLGYQAGDELIHQVANVIKEQLHDSAIVARMGGDEFGVFIEDCPLEKATNSAEKILLAVSSKDFLIEDRSLKVTISIGAAPVTEDTESVASLLISAEVARSAAKDMGKNNIQTYHKENQEIINRKDEMKWVSKIQTALRTNQFQLYCQVIEPLKDNTTPLNNNTKHFHMEILLRLKDENNNILSPGSFIPAAERYYLMPEVDRWVVSETLKLFSEYWPILKDEIGKIAINLSGQTLGAKKFLDFVIKHINNSTIPAEHICFEITESAAIANLENAKHFISELKNKKFQFSLDDFGTGLSSFEYLKTLNVDYLKIDGSFVKQIVNDPIAETMVSAINQVGHVMQLETIAEFVENDAIKEKLKVIGIDFAQGYGIGKPRPLQQYLDELSEKQRPFKKY